MNIYIAYTKEHADILCNHILKYKPTILSYDTESSTTACRKVVERSELYCDVLALGYIPHKNEDFQNSEIPYMKLPFVDENNMRKTQNEKYISNVNIFIISLSMLNGVFPLSLVDVLTERYIVKVGCDTNIDNNFLISSLENSKKQVNPCIDIQTINLTKGFRNSSLSEIGKYYLGIDKLKFNHIESNWSGKLNENYLSYVATDAYITLLSYYEMVGLTQTKIKEDNINFEDINDEIDEMINFLSKNNIFISKNPPTLNKIQSIVLNSYSKYKSLLPQEVNNRINIILDNLLKTGHILKENGYYYLRDIRYTDIHNISISQEDINVFLKYSSIKIDKIANFLFSKFTFPLKQESLWMILINKYWPREYLLLKIKYAKITCILLQQKGFIQKHEDKFFQIKT